MQTNHSDFTLGDASVHILSAGLLAAALTMILYVAPTEQTMGHAQRIVYIHVAVAWLGLFGFLVMAGSGIMYLVGRDLKWDRWFQSTGELGWLCCGLTLVTGSLWARAAWGTWWTWDPRLTTSFILWVIYSGILIVRGSLDEPHQRARIGAILAVLGLLDIPLVVMATRWFRGIHPVSPEMAPVMRIAMLLSVVAFTLLFVLLAARRQFQLRLEAMTNQLQRELNV